jgi:hypothetical protein
MVNSMEKLVINNFINPTSFRFIHNLMTKKLITNSSCNKRVRDSVGGLFETDRLIIEVIR